MVDASVVAKWFFNEELSKTARRVLHGGYDLHAPDFMFMEIDKLLMRKIRRGDTDKKLADEIRAATRSYAIQVHAFMQFRELAWESPTKQELLFTIASILLYPISWIVQF